MEHLFPREWFQLLPLLIRELLIRYQSRLFPTSALCVLLNVENMDVSLEFWKANSEVPQKSW